MKTFKQFMEAYLDTEIQAGKRSDWNASRFELKQKKRTEGYRKVGSLNGCDVYEVPQKLNDGVNVSFVAVLPGGRSNAEATIRGELVGKDLNIDTMATKQGGEVRMHEFILFLIKELGLRVGSNNFSTGGKNVFDKLSNTSGVRVDSFRDHEHFRDEPDFSDDMDTIRSGHGAYVVAQRKH